MVDKIPEGLSKHDWKAYRMRQILRSQLAPGEQLIGAVFIHMPPPFALHYLLFGWSMWFLKCSLNIGLSNEALLLIHQDEFEKPTKVERFVLDDILAIQFKQGWLNDRLIINIVNQKPVRLEITYRLREQAKMIVTAFTHQTGT